MTKPTVKELIAERIEKAGEDQIRSELHRGAGNQQGALSWEISREYAQATAYYLSRFAEALTSILETEGKDSGLACRKIAFSALNPESNDGDDQ